MLTQELRRAQGDRDFHKGRADSLEIGLASHLEQVNTWRAQLEVRLQSLQDELAHARMTQTAPVHIGAPADVRVRIPVIGDMETTVELRVDVPGVVLARAAQQAVGSLGETVFLMVTLDPVGLGDDPERMST